MRPPTLLSLPSYLAGHVARIGHRSLVQALADQGLRLPHFAVLAALNDFGPLPQHQLADRLGLNRSHLVGYLDDLERAGHAQRERDPSDRRRQQVTLSRSGHSLFAKLARLADESEARHLAPLTAKERRILTDLLRRVVIHDDENTTRDGGDEASS
jgi:DNA-binding MarR family transcriptional regulator